MGLAAAGRAGGGSRLVKVLGAPGPERYPANMTTDDIRALPVERKIQIMEAIWADFREPFERSEISPQQKELLDRRRAQVREGAARLLDWDAVKGTSGGP